MKVLKLCVQLSSSLVSENGLELEVRKLWSKSPVWILLEENAHRALVCLHHFMWSIVMYWFFSQFCFTLFLLSFFCWITNKWVMCCGLSGCTFSGVSCEASRHSSWLCRKVSMRSFLNTFYVPLMRENWRSGVFFFLFLVCVYARVCLCVNEQQQETASISEVL